MSLGNFTMRFVDEPPYRLEAKGRVGGDGPAVTPVEVSVRFGPARDGAAAVALVRLEVEAGSQSAMRLLELLQRGAAALREGASSVELDIHEALNARG